MQTLKDLAKQGRTVIITIHQPRSEIWDLFDQVVLLAHGSCIYSGSTENCLPYFKGLEYDIPPFVNPAEYLIDLAAIDNRTKESESQCLERHKDLKSAWSKYQQDNQQSIRKNSIVSTVKLVPKVSMWKQFSVLTRRGVLVSMRDPKGFTGTILEALIVGVTLGLTFYKLDDSLQGIRSREGSFYTAAAVQGYLMLVYEIYRLTEDTKIFDREYNEGVITVAPFLLARRAAKALEDIPISLIFSFIFYFMVGLKREAASFLIFFCVALLVQLTSVTVAMFSISYFRDFARSSMVGFAIFGYSVFAGGCFVPATRLPVYVSWVKWISYMVS
jgi:ABC-2 type transporter